MKLKEKISLEKIFEKEYKIKLVEPENNKEAVITHFLHNNMGDNVARTSFLKKTVKKDDRTQENVNHDHHRKIE